jgi:glycine/D-amino acid oxidase-like deaminating enzyme
MGGPKILVIGAGIVGAALAWHLAREGAAVRVISAAPPGGVATANSWAWINASWGNPENYFRFRFASLQRWQRLAQEVPQLGFNRSGSLTYDLDEPELRAFVREHAGWGYPIRLVAGDEIAQLEPGLKLLPPLAAFAEAEGVVEPVMAAQALLADSGVRVLASEVHAISVRAGKVTGVMTGEGPILADEVIIAAGAQSARLAATAGVKLDVGAPGGVLVHTQVLPKLLTRLVVGPRIHLRQTAEGRIVAGSDFGGSPIEAGPETVADEMMALIRASVRGAEAAELYRYSVGYRPTPADGLPIISRAGVPGLYVAVMHSGVTNAPLVGALVAQEILTGTRDGLLAPFGLDRFAIVSA